MLSRRTATRPPSRTSLPTWNLTTNQTSVNQRTDWKEFVCFCRIRQADAKKSAWTEVQSGSRLKTSNRNDNIMEHRNIMESALKMLDIYGYLIFCSTAPIVHILEIRMFPSRKSPGKRLQAVSSPRESCTKNLWRVGVKEVWRILLQSKLKIPKVHHPKIRPWGHRVL